MAKSKSEEAGATLEDSAPVETKADDAKSDSSTSSAKKRRERNRAGRYTIKEFLAQNRRIKKFGSAVQEAFIRWAQSVKPVQRIRSKDEWESMLEKFINRKV